MKSGKKRNAENNLNTSPQYHRSGPLQTKTTRADATKMREKEGRGKASTVLKGSRKSEAKRKQTGAKTEKSRTNGQHQGRAQATEKRITAVTSKRHWRTKATKEKKIENAKSANHSQGKGRCVNHGHHAQDHA